MSLSCWYVATDINPKACVATMKTVWANKGPFVDIIQGSYLDALSCLCGNVDLLFFNPPYVPTEAIGDAGEPSESHLTSSWAGGHKGRQIIDKFLKKIPVRASRLLIFP